MMETVRKQTFPWRIFWSELIGTGLLLLIGLSFVIFMFGAGSPMESIIPDLTTRRIITGFMFGGTGALIALSPVGRESGAHINPVVTIVFLLYQKIDLKTASVYIFAQFAGCVLGA